MRSPQRTGLEWPRPGTGVFQMTFWVGVHFVTTSRSRLLPSSPGPRHHGQSFSATAGSAAAGLSPRSAECPAAGSATEMESRARGRKRVVIAGFPGFGQEYPGDCCASSYTRGLTLIKGCDEAGRPDQSGQPALFRVFVHFVTWEGEGSRTSRFRAHAVRRGTATHGVVPDRGVLHARG